MPTITGNLWINGSTETVTFESSDSDVQRAGATWLEAELYNRYPNCEMQVDFSSVGFRRVGVVAGNQMITVVWDWERAEQSRRR